MSTVGTELMNQLTSGELDRATPETVNKVRGEVIPALLELIDYGFRARPLLLAERTVGFVRGLHPTERRQLFTWFNDPADRIYFLLSHGTTLSHDVIEGLDGYEAQQLLRVIDRMTDADVSLYPYISAFATTSASEVLWHGRGATVASWLNREVELPGGFRFKLLAPPDHARLWSGVAFIRERAKRRLDDTYNAAMITRALTGKGADKLYTALKKNQQALAADIPDPWTLVVRPDLEGIDFGDGWGHSHQDDSVEGIMREVEGMSKMDKHEKFMEAFYNQQMEQAKRAEEELENQFRRAVSEAGVEDSMSVLSNLQVQQLDRRLAQAQGEQAAYVTQAISSIHAAEERRESRS